MVRDDCEFEFHSRKIKYLLFSFPRSDNDAKRDIEFCHCGKWPTKWS